MASWNGLACAAVAEAFDKPMSCSSQVVSPVCLDAHPVEDAFASSSFRALLDAACSADCLDGPRRDHCVKVRKSTPATVVVSPDRQPKSSHALEKRRQQNRLSCRKTRLRRKLEQSEMEILLRQRNERHVYLLHLRSTLQLHQAECATVKPSELRAFAVRNLHYSLVDPEYHVEPALGMHKLTLEHQWQRVAQDFKALDLHVTSVSETAKRNGLVDVRCQWRFVATHIVSLDRCVTQQVAVTGETTVVFSKTQMTLVTMQVLEQTIAEEDISSSALDLDDTTEFVVL